MELFNYNLGWANLLITLLTTSENTLYRVAFFKMYTLIRGFVIFTYSTNENCQIFKYHEISN